MTLTIGVDIGGTKVAAGVVDESGTILARTRVDTPPHNPTAVEDAIDAAVAELRALHDVEAVGVGVAGFVDRERAKVYFAANLRWADLPLREILRDRLGLPVIVENDANAAAWGEFHFGAGRNETHIVCVTIGTGIGGGVITDGELLKGVRYRAGGATTHSLVMRSKSGTIRLIESHHQLAKLRAYSSVDFDHAGPGGTS